VYSTPIENEEALQQPIFWCLSNHWQPHRNLWKGTKVHESEVPMRALIQLEDILSIYCEF
jgi:hypothetical protein